MIHALLVMCQYAGLTLLYESRCWMTIESGIFYYTVKVIFCIDNITRSILYEAKSSRKHDRKLLHHYIEETCCPPKQVQKVCGHSPIHHQLSSVIYFRHNDMQDCVIKLGKWYRTAVAEARGRLFVLFFLRKLAEAKAM